ncbi:MAG: threonine/serine exporter family protein [Myxococcales bacterium]
MSDTESHRALILELGRMLQRHGVPCRHVELALEEVAQRLGIEVEVFATVTALIVTFEAEEHSRTSLTRVTPTDVDLGALTVLDRIVHRLLDGSLAPAAARLELAQLAARRRDVGLFGMRTTPVSSALRMLMAALGAAGWCGLLGGGLREAVAAALAGALLDAGELLAERHRKFTREFTALAGVIAGATVTWLAATWPPLAREAAIVGALIPLLPGLSLVTAAEELASKDVVTGSARLIGASLVFAQLIFGVAVGTQLQRVLPATVAPTERIAWSLPAQLCMLGPAVLGLAMRLRTELRDLGWFFLAGLIGFLSGRTVSPLFGVEIGSFVGAFVVGATGNALARHLERPALLTSVPGVLVLVPGALGYRSASALVAAQPLEGVRIGFSALLVAVALATGLMLAGSLVPPRRTL